MSFSTTVADKNFKQFADLIKVPASDPKYVEEFNQASKKFVTHCYRQAKPGIKKKLKRKVQEIFGISNHTTQSVALLIKVENDHLRKLKEDLDIYFSRNIKQLLSLQDVNEDSTTQICKMLSMSKGCRYGSNCKFSHETEKSEGVDANLSISNPSNKKNDAATEVDAHSSISYPSNNTNDTFKVLEAISAISPPSNKINDAIAEVHEHSPISYPSNKMDDAAETNYSVILPNHPNLSHSPLPYLPLLDFKSSNQTYTKTKTPLPPHVIPPSSHIPLTVNPVVPTVAAATSLLMPTSNDPKLSIKQQKINASLEKRKHQRRLETQLANNKNNQDVSQEMIQQSIISSSVDRIISMFPTIRKRAPSQAHKLAKVDPFRTWNVLPFVPAKKHVSWIAVSQQDISSPSVLLSEELMQFYMYVSLTKEEKQARDRLLGEVSELVKIKWPTATVQPFGSYYSDMSIFLSDVDVTVLGLGLNPNEQNFYGYGSTSPTAISTHSFSSSSSLINKQLNKNEAQTCDSKGIQDSCNEDTKSYLLSENHQSHIQFHPRTDEKFGVFFEDSDNSVSATSPLGWLIDTVKSETNEQKENEFEFIQDESDNGEVNIFSEVYVTDDSEDHREGDGDNHGDSNSNYDENDDALLHQVDDGFASDSDEEGRRQADVVQDEYIGTDDVFVESSTTKGNGVEECSSKDNFKQPRIDSSINQVNNTNLSDFSFNLLNGAQQLLSKSTGSGPGHQNIIDLTELSENGSVNVQSSNKYYKRQRSDSSSSEEIIDLTLDDDPDAIDDFQLMDWVKEVELRSRAKVPIISFTHRSNVSADISLGIQSKDTTDLVTQMKNESGPCFIPLVSFLKVFLGQFDLDQPFTGGLGSFKLYAMVAYIIQNSNNRTDLGRLLLLFLNYYGDSKNFNLETVIKVGYTEVSFKKNRLAESCQRLFKRAAFVLQNAILSRPSSSEKKLNRKKHTLSNSIIGCLIDSEKLQLKRNESQHSCCLIAPFQEGDRLKLAERILGVLNQRVAPKAPISITDIAQTKPLLLCRLKSYQTFDYALKQINSKKSEIEQQNQRLLSKKTKVVSNKPRFTRGGVVGSQFMPETLQSRRKSSKRKRDIDAKPQYNNIHSNFKASSGPKGLKRMRSDSDDGQEKFRKKLDRIRETHLKELEMKAKLLSRNVSYGGKNKVI